MTPTVGRIVHYTTAVYDGARKMFAVRAAIIVAVSEEDEPADFVYEENNYKVTLRVLDPKGSGDDFTPPFVSYGEVEPGTEQAEGTWTWPERVS